MIKTSIWLIMLSMLFYFSSKPVKCKMMCYSKKDILAALDELSPYTFFLDLEHGYFYTSGSRITLFADQSRWAIVFEKSGYANRGFAGAIELNYYGNCLVNLDKVNGSPCNAKLYTLIEPKELKRIEGDFEMVSKDIKEIKVRDTFLTINSCEVEESSMDFPSLIRCLDENNQALFRAKAQELKACLPDDLPKIMHIDQWHHVSYGVYDDETLPSAIETFQLIADVLISKDSSKWQPTLTPNNDWRNWPRAGNL